MTKKLGKREIKELQKQLPELPAYHYVCMNCGGEYEKNEKYNYNSVCIYCNSPDVFCEEDEK